MEQKNAVFVICEYNPFHYGHLYQLGELKKRYETVICVMSGDSVQRGSPAVYEKRVRARAAVACGADAVFELPYPFSCMAAADFARAGVAASRALGAESLAFGVESDLETVMKIASVRQDDGVEALVRSEKNLSYPKAMARLIALREGEAVAAEASRPNNILAAEYIRACRNTGFSPEFVAVKRNGSFEPASFVRTCRDMTAHVPAQAAAVFSGCPVRREENLSVALLAASRRLDGESDVYGMSRGDVLRLRAAALASETASEAVARAVSGNVTKARARRGMLSALLGISREDASVPPKYIWLLSANENGCRYIATHRKSFLLPVVSRPAHIARLGPDARAAFERQRTAESVLALSADSGRAFTCRGSNNIKE